LTKRPQDRAILAQTLVLCHLVIEGVLAIPGQHFIQRWITKQGILPGLTSGIDNVVSDETRHVTFGTKLLNDLMAASDECRSAVVEMLDRCTPWTVGVFIPPRRDHSYVECFDFTLKEIYAFGLRALETRVTNIGLDPGELYLVSRDDRSLTHEQRAERLLRLVEDGILGDNARDPEVSNQSLEILFEATTRSIDIGLARSLGGPIEWAFTDAEPWHLVVVNDHAEVKPGRAGEPALRLELTSADWARIAVGRADPRRALLTRRLRVHGAWHAIRKLPKLFT
ncbi:MAG: SCP2 sterol-binding domain-containing protein, partial [Actinomycetota bacterium]